ncbi:death-associated protein kinase related [Nasonia vitripennis]|uniref:non-specific serine/threonine protein kinase n=1 Tax=Nasonia vitripennis TaxID=7425 RepID=A0A7M7Q839_NASVI|nr:death-associated protein kinase related [Nasonia vitripennis]
MAGDGLFETTSIPGHLAPTPERLERLLSKQTLEELYEVEEQPFARGKYATVRRCRERTSGRQWAAKFLRKRRRAQELKAEALHEVAVLDAAAHCPRLVSLHQVFETSTEMVLVLELAPGGELQMVLDRDEIPEERQVAKLLKQILDGVAFLHSLNVAHLDIKPQNLVLTGEFPDCDVKLCDFGISRYISHGADIREILGTPDYIAPEVLNYEPISLATDMWSVGVLLYVLLTGCSPFGGDSKQETFCNISRCRLDFPDDLFEEVSQEAQDLIRRLIVKNPSERLSASECLQHSWFGKFEDVESPLALYASESSSACDNAIESLTAEHKSDDDVLLLDLSVDETVEGVSIELEPTAEVEPVEDRVAEPADEEESATLEVVATEQPESEPDNETSLELETVEETETTSGALELDIQSAEEHVEPDGSSDPLEEQELAEQPCLNSTTPSSDTGSSERVYLRRMSSTVPRTSSRHQFTGLSSERRSNFKRSMDYLASKFSASADLLSVLDDGVLDMETSSRRSSVNSATSLSESVFKCTPVFILGEEQQCSDSGSDTVSEISTDSSSDRSSIYSDDSLDFILYGKTTQGRVSYPFSASESHSWKQRNGLGNGNNSSSSSSSTNSANSAASGLRHGPRVWPRECNGAVSKALSRFTSSDHHHYRHVSSSMSSVSSSTTSSKSPIVSVSSSISSSISLTSSSAIRTSTTRMTGLEALRREGNRGESLVVIREPVRAGRYMRYSEVQCESVQARIRRFQVHGSS